MRYTIRTRLVPVRVTRVLSTLLPHAEGDAQMYLESRREPNHGDVPFEYVVSALEDFTSYFRDPQGRLVAVSTYGTSNQPWFIITKVGGWRPASRPYGWKDGDDE